MLLSGGESREKPWHIKCTSDNSIISRRRLYCTRSSSLGQPTPCPASQVSSLWWSSMLYCLFSPSEARYMYYMPLALPRLTRLGMPTTVMSRARTGACLRLLLQRLGQHIVASWVGIHKTNSVLLHSQNLIKNTPDGRILVNANPGSLRPRARPRPRQVPVPRGWPRPRPPRLAARAVARSRTLLFLLPC